MSKKKTYKAKPQVPEVKESLAVYGNKKIHIFHSFEEQAAYELQEMAKLNSTEILQQLRKFINTAYGMHGYNPNQLPKNHFIKIISK